MSKNALSTRHKVVTRGGGAGVVASAAYMDAKSYEEQRTGQDFKYELRGERVMHSEMILPDGAPASYKDAETLWNAVENNVDIWAEKHYRVTSEKVAKARRELDLSEHAVIADVPFEIAGASPTKQRKWIDQHKKQWRQSDHAKQLKENGFHIDYRINYDGDKATLEAFALSPEEHHKATARTGIKGHVSFANEIGAEGAAEIMKTWAERQADEHGLAVQFVIHDDGNNLHAHWVSTARVIKPDGTFGPYASFLGKKAELSAWEKGNRSEFANAQNEALEEMGLEKRVEHRSFKDQGLTADAQSHEGPIARAIDERGKSRIVDENNEILEKRRSEIDANPWAVVAEIADKNATWTEDRLRSTILKRTGNDEELTERAIAAIHSDQRYIAIGDDGRGRIRYSTQAYVNSEARLFSASESLSSRSTFLGDIDRVNARLDAAEVSQGWQFNDEQRAAIEALATGSNVTTIVGKAGAGKTTIMQQAKAEWTASGYTVKGAALAGVAADNLTREAGIESKTLASYLKVWENRDRLAQAPSGPKVDAFMRSTQHYELTKDTVFVIDEAGMVDARALSKVMDRAEKAGAKVVFVGDPDQLAAIQAGEGLRGVIERHGATELNKIMRQKDEGQRQANEQIADGKMIDGLRHYQDTDRIQWAENRLDLKAGLVSDYVTHAAGMPEQTSLIMAFRRKDVTDLNNRVRTAKIEAGMMSQGFEVMTEEGKREFSQGDRIIFRKNDKKAGVLNGQMGTVERMKTNKEGDVLGLTVRRDDGETVTIDPRTYKDLDHAYATTVHKAQGQTIDQTFVLADKGFRSDLAYVALTRQRHEAQLYADRATFRSFDDLARSFESDTDKDLVADYKDTDAKKTVRAYVENAKHAADIWVKIDARLQKDPDARAWDDPAWTDYAAARDRRQEAAEKIATDWKEHRIAVRGAGLSRDRVEVHAGRRDRLMTEAELGAASDVIAYTHQANKARDLWNEIKATHPGSRARVHPRNNEFVKAQKKRDRLAAALHKSAPKYRKHVKNASHTWKAIKTQAEMDKARQLFTAIRAKGNHEDKVIGKGVYDYATRRNKLAADFQKIAKTARADGQKPAAHKDFAQWKQGRDKLDLLAARITGYEKGEKVLKAAENAKILKEGEIYKASRRAQARELVQSYTRAATAGQEAQQDSTAAKIKSEIEQTAIKGEGPAMRQAVAEAGIPMREIIKHAKDHKAAQAGAKVSTPPTPTTKPEIERPVVATEPKADLFAIYLEKLKDVKDTKSAGVESTEAQRDARNLAAFNVSNDKAAMKKAKEAGYETAINGTANVYLTNKRRKENVATNSSGLKA